MVSAARQRGVLRIRNTAFLIAFTPAGCKQRLLPETELLKPVRNLLYRGTVAYASGSAGHTVYPTRCKIEGRFLAGLPAQPCWLSLTIE